VINALPPDVPVLFLPDLYLGNYLRKVTAVRSTCGSVSVTCMPG